MPYSDSFETDDNHPIDIVEHLATKKGWEFARTSEEQIAMEVEGQWRTYSVTLAWSTYDETLRLVCTFEFDFPKEKLSTLHDLLNSINDRCWVGNFSYWESEKMIIYRYGLVLAGGAEASPEQIDTMIACAIMVSERYYPALQLVGWTEKTPAQALETALTEAYGHA
jgi:hypothetical protein